MRSIILATVAVLGVTTAFAYPGYADPPPNQNPPTRVIPWNPWTDGLKTVAAKYFLHCTSNPLNPDPYPTWQDFTGPTPRSIPSTLPPRTVNPVPGTGTPPVDHCTGEVCEPPVYAPCNPVSE